MGLLSWMTGSIRCRMADGFTTRHRTQAANADPEPPRWDNPLMDISLNGNPTPVADGCTVTALLEHMTLTERRVAIEVNGAIVPRPQHAATVLRPGDRVEIVHALGGG
jgi:sulfur carrier protein